MHVDRTEHCPGERTELGLETLGRLGDLGANRPVQPLRLPLVHGRQEVVLVVEVLVDERSRDLRRARRPSPS